MIFKPLTKKELEEANLTIVREIGRVIGVKSPTSKPKDTIIEEIIQIQSGELEPVPPSNIGAPPKTRVDISKYLAELPEDTPYDFEDTVDDKITFRDYIDENGMSDKGEFVVTGVLEQMASGYGFLRVNNYENSKQDVYVSIQNIKAYNLRRGDKVKALAKFVSEKESAALQKVIQINDLEPELFLNRKNFDELTPYYPTVKINLENELNSEDVSIRCIDLFAPLGMGQRGLIVAPPKTGKTTILKKIAQAIEKNYPNIKLIVLLIDERPEEVTDIKRFVSGEVVFSTFDESAEHHIRAAELVVNRAKRLVEVGQNVVILMDSITRLVRAYNNTVESSGKTLSGGLDPVAMQGPKKFFGAARNIEDGGSLTILSTALVETGSRMDDVIYEEFKGTGNMEIHLSKELSEKRIFPAIDLYKSGTRNDELILTSTEYKTVMKLRKILSSSEDSTDALIEIMNKTKNNADLSSKIDVWMKLLSK
ncbi:MAG: transcription termination factor Rho [Clostridia bacterium]|nr:transcription termination factor Rho [Clostridia bacterium]